MSKTSWKLEAPISIVQARAILPTGKWHIGPRGQLTFVKMTFADCPITITIAKAQD